ncbi:MAG: roadblock/LC7 domain-containing protein [Chloroflexi bacterium]|nr:roadblock/LC7 domain-containing protein [Chloroflexota bacterium]MCY3582664.1 roadblock/LC7 domain-containing protein [Chloroflexota bacterium]MCY3717779.1 roadblock/LC7 domain-containing protein [Chloroflexota bacterium]MDE2651468.1 roadblock/LC7 domain-containing protein [Chloroflexota bacterium]
MPSPDRSPALQETLRRLTSVAEGIVACAVFADEGFVIAAQPAAGEDAAQLAAICANLVFSADGAMKRLVQGRLARLLLDAEHGALLCCKCGDAWLAALIEADASLAHALFAAQKASDDIESIMAGEWQPD